MINGNTPQQPERELPTNVQDLTEMVKRLERLCDLFRQQRDKASSLANDLQVELALAQHKIEELEAERPGPSDLTNVELNVDP